MHLLFHSPISSTVDDPLQLPALACPVVVLNLEVVLLIVGDEEATQPILVHVSSLKGRSSRAALSYNESEGTARDKLTVSP